jgi:hypothetical protein
MSKSRCNRTKPLGTRKNFSGQIKVWDRGEIIQAELEPPLPRESFLRNQEDRYPLVGVVFSDQTKRYIASVLFAAKSFGRQYDKMEDSALGYMTETGLAFDYEVQQTRLYPSHPEAVRQNV